MMCTERMSCIQIEKKKEEDRKYFVIKRFCSTGNVFVFYIDATGEGFLGDALTEHQGDMEYEYWKLVQLYTHLLVQDGDDTEKSAYL